MTCQLCGSVCNLIVIQKKIIKNNHFIFLNFSYQKALIRKLEPSPKMNIYQPSATPVLLNCRTTVFDNKVWMFLIFVFFIIANKFMCVLSKFLGPHFFPLRLIFSDAISSLFVIVLFGLAKV